MLFKDGLGNAGQLAHRVEHCISGTQIVISFECACLNHNVFHFANISLVPLFLEDCDKGGTELLALVYALEVKLGFDDHLDGRGKHLNSCHWYS